MRNDEALLEVENLHKYFPVRGGVFQRKVADLKAVDGISFHINRGETLGLVGESGCGKTTTGRCIIQLYKVTKGKVFYEGTDLGKLSSGKMRSMRRHVQMIFEDPHTSLDSCMSVGEILVEPLKLHHMAKKAEEYQERVAELLRTVGLEPYMAIRHPPEFSAGQRQRIEIARVLSLEPDFIVCDNPVAQLDVSIQAQIVTMLQRLQEELKLTYLFIAHDLVVVRNISDRVMVMYVGKIIETAKTDQLFDNPRHPYTKALLSAVLTPDPKVESERKVIILPGEIPSSITPPNGCRFHPRCSRVMDICQEQEPELKNIATNHWVACHRV
ncbi:Oligopeptide transport ATP-binding protein OppF [subsurface metagenome]